MLTKNAAGEVKTEAFKGGEESEEESDEDEEKESEDKDLLF